jgi:anti-sigma regulatory factor (Ser/Thr protein kinase)
VQVDGAPRDLAPLVRDEIHRIASEALRNAFRHAHAGRIEVEIRYDQRQLRLLVRDNGKGIDPRFLVEAAAPDTMACQACTNAPNLRGVSWLSGVS